jgi:hypothetical protein
MTNQKDYYQVTREDLEVLIRSLAPLSEVGAKNLLRLLFLTMRHYLASGYSISCRPLGFFYPEEGDAPIVKLCKTRSLVTIQDDEIDESELLEDKKVIEQAIVKKSLVTYFRNDFNKKRGWLHPNTGISYRYELMLNAFTNLQSHETEYKIVHGKWIEKRPFEELAVELYMSASSCRRKEARAVNLLILWLVVPTLPIEVTKEIS